eukprot:gene16216-biopygen13132
MCVVCVCFLASQNHLTTTVTERRDHMGYFHQPNLGGISAELQAARQQRAGGPLAARWQPWRPAGGPLGGPGGPLGGPGGPLAARLAALAALAALATLAALAAS